MRRVFVCVCVSVREKEFLLYTLKRTTALTFRNKPLILETYQVLRAARRSGARETAEVGNKDRAIGASLLIALYNITVELTFGKWHAALSAVRRTLNTVYRCLLLPPLKTHCSTTI